MSLVGEGFISIAEARSLTGYTRQHLALICRRGDVVCRKSGKTWEVKKESLIRFSEAQRKKAEERRTEIAEERRREYERNVLKQTPAEERAERILKRGGEYLSLEAARALTGYTDKYLAALSRTGKVAGRKQGNAFEIDKESLLNFVADQKQKIEERRAEVAEARRREYEQKVFESLPFLRRLGRRLAVPVPHALAYVFLFTLISFGASFSTYYNHSPRAMASAAQYAAHAVAEFDAGLFVTRLQQIPSSAEVVVASAPEQLAFSLDAVREGLRRWFSTDTVYVNTYTPVPTPTPSQVVERVVERSPTTVVQNVTESVTVSGISTQELERRLSELESRVIARIPSFSGVPPVTVVNTQTFAHSQQIDQLNGVTITDATIVGGSISGIDVGASNLSDLNDLALSSPSYGNLLLYTGSEWENVATSTLGVALSDTTGTLPVSRGGTGTSTAPSYGEVLVGNAAGGYDLVATSSLGISGGGGSFGQGWEINGSGYLAPTSTLTALLPDGFIAQASSTATGLTITDTATTSNLVIGSLTGVLKAAAGVVSTGLVNLASEVSGILSVAFGGTGWGEIQANTVLLGNGTNRLATTSAGTNGQVLSLVGGTPSWVATTTAGTGLTYDGTSFNNAGVLSVSQTYGSAQTGALTFATSSAASFNGLTIASAITNSGATFTFASPTITGTLDNAGLTNSSVSYGGVALSLGNSDATPAFDLSDATGLPISAGTTGILPATRGGTGWSAIQANTILLGNGTGQVATTSAGTNGQVLSLVGGTPSWVATTTFSGPLNYASGDVTLDTSGTWTGNAGTASALAANGANCSAGNAPLGVDDAGAAEGCFDVWTEAENTAAAYIALADLSATFPITYNSGTGAIGFNGLSTSTNAVVGNIPYFSGANTFANIATSSITYNATLTTSGTPGYIVGGSGFTLGVATTSNALFTGAAGQVLAYLNDGWTGVATTTFSSGLTYSSGNVTADLGTSIDSSEIVDDSIVNDDINSSAAIAYSKLNLADSLTFTDIAYNLTLAGDPALGASETFFGTTGIIFEGSSADTFEGLLTSANITGSDKTWTLPNTTGTIALLTSAMTGTFDGNNFAGGAVAQGDILYGSAAGVISELAKDTNATRYLSNTGTNNNPAWAQIDLTNGVTGTLPVASGGTGATTFTNNRLLTGNGTSGIVDEANLTFDGSTLTVNDELVPGYVRLSGDSSDRHFMSTTVTDDFLGLAGGWTYNAGGGIRLYGQSHATNADEVELRYGGGSHGVGGITALSVISGGNIVMPNLVGVGTTTPSSQFTVGSAVGSSWTDTNNPQVLIIGVDNEVSTEAFKIRDENNSDYFVVSSVGGSNDGQSYFKGNVGIGTTTPWAQLSVEGQGSKPSFVVSDTSNNTDFIVTETGNVGIGTTDPQSALDVNGTLTLRPSNSISTIQTNSSNARIDYITNRGQSTQLAHNFVVDGSTQALVIQDDGNVGIGTTTPWAQLSVEGQGSKPSFVVSDTSNNTDFIVTETGLVGIGSTTPSELLSVGGGRILQSASAPVALTNTGGASFRLTDVLAVGNYVYAQEGVGGAGNLNIYDVSNPAAPTLISQTGTSAGTGNYLAALGKYVVMSVNHSTDNLQIFDVSNPNAPILVESFNTGSALATVDVAGRYAYVGANSGGNLRVVDLTDPENPSLAGSVALPNMNAIVKIIADGPYAYVIASTSTAPTAGFQIVDISDAAAPTLIGTYAAHDAPGALAVDGRYAYIAGEGAVTSTGFLEVVDISNPASPTQVALLTLDNGMLGSRSELVGNYLYLADRDGIRIIDVSNPASPSVAVAYSASRTLTALSISGAHIYFGVTNTSDGLYTAKLSGAVLPTARIGATETSSLTVNQTGRIGRNLYVDGGVNVGTGGLFSSGGIAAFVASSTAANPIAGVFMGGNVGIGTTTPTASLSVDGDFLIHSGNDVLHLSQPSDNIWDFAFGENGFATNNVGIRFDGTGNGDDNALHIYNYNGSTPITTFERGGNVGIGTTSPGTSLHVYSSSGANQLRLQRENDTTYLDFGVGTAYAALNVVNNSAGGLFDIQDDGTSRFFITDTGNVGIGTTSPNSKLTVTGNTTVGAKANVTAIFRAGDATSIDAQLGLGVTSGNRPFVAAIDGTGTGAASLDFYTDNDLRMRIDAATGNIGIGTTSPLGKLHAYSAGSGVATANANADELVLENSANSGLSVLTPNSSIGYIMFGDPEDNDVGLIGYNHSSDVLTFAADGGGTTMTFNGNSLYNFDTSDPEFRLSDNTINARLKVLDASGLAYVGTNSSHPFQLFTNNSAKLTIDSSGNVGIGTSTPNNLLTLSENGADTVLGFESLGGSIAGNEGALYGGAGASNGIGDVAWTSPGNAAGAADATYANANVSCSGSCETPEELHVTDFGFSVPTSADVVGIYVEILRGAITLSGASNDTTVQLVSSSSLVGDNKGYGNSTEWPFTTDVWYPYGGDSDDWNASLTASDVNDSSFGVAIQPTIDAASIVQFYVDAVRITVYYEENGALNWAAGVVNTGGSYRITNNTSLSSDVMFEITPDGRVGIATSSPSYALDIDSGNNNPFRWFGADSSFVASTGGITYTTTQANTATMLDLVDQDNSTTAGIFRARGNAGAVEGLWIGSSGRVGIGTAAPAVKLEVEETGSDGTKIRIQDSDGTCNLNPESGSLSTSCSSDARLKSDITAATSTLDYILNIPLRDFTVIASGDRMTGVVAQELLELPDYSDLVHLPEDEDEYYTVEEISSWRIIRALQEVIVMVQELAEAVANFAEEIMTRDLYVSNKLCVGETCITETELKELLALRAGAPATAGAATPTGTEDTTAPTLAIQGNNPAHIEIGTTYADLGVIVSDNTDQNLGHKVFVDGEEVKTVSLSTASSTTYTIRYEATDQAGNTGYAERTVIVGGGENTEASIEEDTETPTEEEQPEEESVEVAEESEEEQVDEAAEEQPEEPLEIEEDEEENDEEETATTTPSDGEDVESEDGV